MIDEEKPVAPGAVLPAPPIRVLSLRVLMRADTAMSLPRWKGALLRGGLGRALKSALCDPGCSPDDGCPSVDCAYRTIFAPEADGERSELGGLRDVPRPYAVRPPLDAQIDYRAGDLLPFGLVLAGKAIEYLPHVTYAFEALGEMGLGQGRGRARLHSIESYDPLGDRRAPLLRDGVLRNEIITVGGEDIVSAAARMPDRLRLRFPTPMRLKHGGQMVVVPECHVLIRAALRRVSQLSAFFGDGPWKAPFAQLVQMASRVRLVERQTRWVDWSRTSGATGQHMTLGGFVGSAIYEPVPAAVRAVLLAGSLMHIGKAVVFGHGAYDLDPPVVRPRSA